MKKIFAIAALFTGVLLTACDKKDVLSHYNDGVAPTVTASSTNVAPAPADSNKVALTLSWSAPAYATDSSKTKYIIEIDSATKNFSKPLTKTISGTKSVSFTAKELNTFLVGRGYAFSKAVTMEARVTSSYGNNNEQLKSSSVSITMTPYKVPPKIALPATEKLFIVGDATDGGWNNPVPTPSQEFSRLDETTWAGVFNLTGGKQYLLLPKNGDWGQKYAVASNTVPGVDAGGDFQFYTSGGDNFPAPATSGLYKIVIDFQQGKFTVTPYGSTLPTDLFIVGDATAGGWNNPVPVPSQQLTRVNSSVWEISLSMEGGKEFLVLSSNGDWSKKYALKDNGVAGISLGGEFGYHQDGQPAPDDFQKNFKGPATTGTYKLTLNFAAPTTIAGASGKFTIQ